jgi:hypothetical protein
MEGYVESVGVLEDGKWCCKNIMIGGVLENLEGMSGLEEWEKYWKE